MLRSLALAALAATTALAAGTTCDLDNKCPEDAPCCSQFGECGVGAYCLGGCDPRMSFSFEACVPAPVCKDSHTVFKNMDSIVDIGDYLGDADDGTWVGQGELKEYDDALLLTMGKDTPGSIISSTTYMWYGSVKTKMKTSRGQGVVSAFILYSDVKDEIDYEFIGADLETAQTMFYQQAITNSSNAQNISTADTWADFHEYEINWTPDQIQWLVDGDVKREKNRVDTWNETSNQWAFPQTPARVQFSVWPAGSSDNPEGTIQWAGGLIDWDSEDIKENGYYFATVSEVTMKCFDADNAPGTNKGKSYTYKDDSAGTNDTVIDGDKDTVLASLGGSGLNMDEGKETKTKSGSKPTNTAATIPGGGSVGDDHSNGESGGDSSGGSSGATAPANTENCPPGSFSMACGDDADKSKDGSGGGGNSGSRASASALAIIIAGCALYWL